MKILILFSLLLTLGACVTQPDYRDVGSGTDEINPRDVNYRLFAPLHRDPPECIVVLKAKADANPAMGRDISRALARYLGEKVDRVIFPRHRIKLEHKNGLDLENEQDRKQFARMQKCRFYARAQLYDLGDDYVAVFAKKHIGLRLDLVRISDEAPLWQAAHTVWRANGGLPLSPIGAVGGFAQATMFSQDQDIMPSLIDDAMRRMVRTLPVSDY